MTSLRAGLISRHLKTIQITISNPIRPTHARYLSAAATPASSPQAPPQKKTGLLRRFLYFTTGLASAGLAVQYATDPKGTKKQARALYDDIDSRIRFFTEPSREKLLPDQVPAYPGAPPVRTLVIDLERTLVYSSYSRATGWRVAKRPGAEAFLAYMAQFYEIVVFTGNLDGYADPILDKMDPNFFISYRLYRAETHYKRGVHIKDLSHLNRDLERVIVIDRDEKQVSMQPENAIIIPEWSGDASDTALLDLIPFLENVVRTDVKDVRDAVGVFKGKSVAEGVEAWRQISSQRESGGRQASLFGHGAEPVPVAGALGGAEDDGGGKGVVWGTLTGSGLFGGGGSGGGGGGGGQPQRSGE